MSESHFNFKKFTIAQNNCAMKVGTDGVLLGAWADISQANNILDLGTGTGLLALMCAQRSNAKITGIEIDELAARQAFTNVENSIWKERISILHEPLESFSGINEVAYDHIIANPPFFLNNLKPGDKSRKIARHMPDEDSIAIWLQCAQRCAKKNAHFSCIIPIGMQDAWLDKAEKYNWMLNRLTHVYPNDSKPAHRLLVEWKNTSTLIKPRMNSLTIESSIRGIYTREFGLLVKDFYLNPIFETLAPSE